ncbi:MAG: linear amide C-N hydrolase [Bacteroidetes bacterium]|nr:linear amide C-N hydrolase [Bacteroidota bacterium]
MFSIIKHAYFSIIKLIFALFLFVSCAEKQPAETSLLPQDNSATILIISGDDQSGNSGDLLAAPIIIQVINSLDSPINNAEISCEIVEGLGEITPSNNFITDSEGKVSLNWRIGQNYNSIKVSLSHPYYEAMPIHLYASSSNPEGVSTIRSINSLEQMGENFYKMSFYGDYSEYLDVTNSRFRITNSTANSTSPKTDYSCSLFSAFGNSEAALYGRSFDNQTGWHCLTLLMEYYPPGKYKSLSLMRLQDIDFEIGTDLKNSSMDTKKRLFEALYHTPDGINEHGVVAGLANVQLRSFSPDPTKKSIWITILVREILDNARNVEEAIAISQQYNICCPNRNTLTVHVMVADPSGNSAILEMYDGEMRVIRNSDPWQVITNSPSYNISILQQKIACNRFMQIYNSLESVNGNITQVDAMNILSGIGWTSTEWSAVYDMTNKTIELAIDYNFNNLYHIGFTE